jgi:glycosyltransferase involved in cell wall biosynthesis
MSRPKVSILFFAYNHERYVEEALLSALRQDGGDFEIVVVDDASTDATRRIMEEVLKREKPPGVRVRRHYKDVNGGLLAAVNDAMALATGEVFVMMAGDDFSLPDRVERCVTVFQANPEVMAVRGGLVKTDDQGREMSPPQLCDKVESFSYENGPSLSIYAQSCPMGAAAAYRAKLFQFFGPMGAGSHGEDNCYWIRALLLGKIYHDDTVHIHWRQHATNISNFQADLKSEEWRRKHLAWMELHARLSPQWLRDIRKARQGGLIGCVRSARLSIAARREDATWALSASTLRPDGWLRWGANAMRMFAVGRFSTVVKMFKTRISASKREQDWAFWFRIRSS